MTECTEAAAGLQLRFDFGLGKPVVGEFTGGMISSDGGLVLIRGIDDRLLLSEQMTMCLSDRRDPSYVKHVLQDLVRQRLYAIAAGYEDGNDADVLKADPMHKICIGKAPVSGTSLASQPTLSRFENGVTATENGFLQELLVRSYIRRFESAPKHIILDVDTTCDPVHGYQQMSFFNGFYHTECYIPLFVFDQDGYPLLARLRPGNFAPAEQAAADLRHVVESLREAWPKTKIELRADAAFCNRDFYRLCEENHVTYYIGLKSNHALRCAAKELVERAKQEYEALYGPANAPRGSAWRRREEGLRFASKFEGRMQERFEQDRRIRIVGEVRYQARGWDMERRVICRCDYTEEGSELRFIVTNSKSRRSKWVYESKYCGRGQCENWIKELKFNNCDRLSCQEFEANQFRLLLHVFAYVLLNDLRRRVSKRHSLLSIGSFRLQFLKLGVLVSESARRVLMRWSSAATCRSDFATLAAALRC